MSHPIMTWWNLAPCKSRKVEPIVLRLRILTGLGEQVHPLLSDAIVPTR
ncbi:hypothetical protein ACVIYL_007701 [Bradyrhizobium sp. USDA 3315]